MVRTKITFLSLSLLTLVAAAPLPPESLAPYIHGDQFDPGDYRWLRGSFSGASVSDVSAFKAMEDWRNRCRASDLAETRDELAKLGVTAGGSLNAIPYPTLMCSQAATLPEPLNLSDWDGFARDVSTVRPIMRTFLTAVDLAERRSLAKSPDLRDELIGRVIGEQMLRAGLDWADGSSAGDKPIENLTPQQRGILVAQLATAMLVRDHANTAWLKRIVIAQGWPKRSQVGEKAAGAAWLLVQHADADPAFQVAALRLIEPLTSVGEVSRKDYAYLYDRVMVKLTGKQRYGTQLTCNNGHVEPLPMEDDQAVESYRLSAGLESLSEILYKYNKKTSMCQ